jgi:rhodanese-related sulfurtransferase/uncharacterized membrane protein YphA (DoxX/SURF4 family)
MTTTETIEPKKCFFRRYTFAEIVRVIFALVFVVTGVLKLSDSLLAFADNVAAYDVLPLWSVHFVAVVFPVLELVVAAMLVTPRFCRVGEFFVGVVLPMFLFFLVQEKVRGLHVESCGCFGKYSGEPWFAIAADSILLVLCGILFWPRRRKRNAHNTPQFYLAAVVCALAVSVVGAFAFNALSKEPLAVFEKYKTKAERKAEKAEEAGFKEFQSALALKRVKNAGADGVVDKEELEKIIEQSKDGEVLLIDARSDLHFADGHIQGAMNISDEHFERDLKTARARIEIAKHLVVYCANTDCGAAEAVVRRLREAGIKTETDIYPGGGQEWEQRTTRESREK